MKKLNALYNLAAKSESIKIIIKTEIEFNKKNEALKKIIELSKAFNSVKELEQYGVEKVNGKDGNTYLWYARADEDFEEDIAINIDTLEILNNDLYAGILY